MPPPTGRRQLPLSLLSAFLLGSPQASSPVPPATRGSRGSGCRAEVPPDRTGQVVLKPAFLLWLPSCTLASPSPSMQSSPKQGGGTLSCSAQKRARSYFIYLRFLCLQEQGFWSWPWFVLKRTVERGRPQRSERKEASQPPHQEDAVRLINIAPCSLRCPSEEGCRCTRGLRAAGDPSVPPEKRDFKGGSGGLCRDGLFKHFPPGSNKESFRTMKGPWSAVLCLERNRRVCRGARCS